MHSGQEAVDPSRSVCHHRTTAPAVLGTLARWPTHLCKVEAPAPEAHIVPQVLHPVHQRLTQVGVGVVKVRRTWRHKQTQPHRQEAGQVQTQWGLQCVLLRGSAAQCKLTKTDPCSFFLASPCWWGHTETTLAVCVQGHVTGAPRSLRPCLPLGCSHPRSPRRCPCCPGHQTPGRCR